MLAANMTTVPSSTAFARAAHVRPEVWCPNPKCRERRRGPPFMTNRDAARKIREWGGLQGDLVVHEYRCTCGQPVAVTASQLGFA